MTSTAERAAWPSHRELGIRNPRSSKQKPQFVTLILLWCTSQNTKVYLLFGSSQGSGNSADPRSRCAGVEARRTRGFYVRILQELMNQPLRGSNKNPESGDDSFYLLDDPRPPEGSKKLNHQFYIVVPLWCRLLNAKVDLLLLEPQPVTIMVPYS